MDNSKTPTPWYKIGLVWMMIGLPFIVVVASLTTAVIAHKNAPTLVPQDGLKTVPSIEQPAPQK